MAGKCHKNNERALSNNHSRNAGMHLFEAHDSLPPLLNIKPQTKSLNGTHKARLALKIDSLIITTAAHHLVFKAAGFFLVKKVKQLNSFN